MNDDQQCVIDNLTLALDIVKTNWNGALATAYVNTQEALEDIRRVLDKREEPFLVL